MIGSLNLPIQAVALKLDKEVKLPVKAGHDFPCALCFAACRSPFFRPGE